MLRIPFGVTLQPGTHVWPCLAALWGPQWLHHTTTHMVAASVATLISFISRLASSTASAPAASTSAEVSTVWRACNRV